MPAEAAISSLVAPDADAASASLLTEGEIFLDYEFALNAYDASQSAIAVEASTLGLEITTCLLYTSPSPRDS